MKTLLRATLLSLSYFALANMPLNAQSAMPFIMDFQNCEYPIYYKGDIKHTQLGPNEDTLKHFTSIHEILIDKVGDTMFVYSYYSSLDAVSIYRFSIKNNVLHFSQLKDYLNFSEMSRILFSRKNIQHKRVDMPIRKYEGKSGETYRNIDSTFNFLDSTLPLGNSTGYGKKNISIIYTIPFTPYSINCYGNKSFRKFKSQDMYSQYFDFDPKKVPRKLRRLNRRINKSYEGQILSERFQMYCLINDERNPQIECIIRKQGSKKFWDDYKANSSLGVYKLMIADEKTVHRIKSAKAW